MLKKRILIVSIALVVVLSCVTVFVSGILNGELFNEETDNITGNKPSEKVELNIINTNDLKKDSYYKIKEKYYKALSENWDHNKMWDENLCYLAGLSKHTNPIENIGYCLMDINGDNQDELLIGEITDGYWGKVIYDLYVIKNGETYILLRSHERNRYILFEENGVYKIALEGTESAAKAFTNYYTFNGNSLKFEKAVILDGTKTPESEQFTAFFVAYDDDFNTDNDTPIDQETAMEIMKSYEEKYITPKFIPFAALKEKGVPVSEEEADKIIEKFNKAYDFWVSWVYGAIYRAYDDPSTIVFGSSRESVTSESPIQSAAGLKAEMEKHFSKELVEKYWKQLMPEDKNGKLYIYTGDVGGPYSGAEKITVEKINDERYRLNLDIWSYMEDEEPDLPDQCVYYVLENGRWVFENDVEDEFFFSREEPEKYNSKEFAPYNEILKAFYAALWQKWDVDRLNKNELPYMLVYSNSKDRAQRLQTIGYSLMDVNGDNQDELLIGEIAEGMWGQVIYAMYTVKDGSVYMMFESGERLRHTLYEEDGKYHIAYEESGSAVVNHFAYSEIVEHELVTEKIIIQDAFEYPDNPWYEQEPQDESIHHVSENEALKIIESYRAKYITPKLIPFEALG